METIENKEQEVLLNKIKAEVNSAVKGEIQPTIDQLKSMENQLKELNATELKDAIIKVQTEVKALKEQGSSNSNTKKTLATQLKENKEELLSIAKGLSPKEIQVKALTQRSSITNNEQAFELQDIGQLATRKLTMYDIFPKLSIGTGNHNGVIRYYDWDEDTIARAAASRAEGVAFPESTAKFKKGSVVIEKIGDTLPVSEEFFEDEEMFAAELGLFLETNVNVEVDRQIALGDGTSNQLVGLMSSIDEYSTPATGTVVDPSIYDLIVKVSEDITNIGGSKYSPDVAIMNIADINRMRLKKDANNNYVLPPFASMDGKMVASMMVLESNIMAANTMVVCDRRFARIYELGTLVLSKGYSGTQFVEDEMTLKVRKRLAFLIRAADKGGFLKVSDIDAALTALTVI